MENQVIGHRRDLQNWHVHGKKMSNLSTDGTKPLWVRRYANGGDGKKIGLIKWEKIKTKIRLITIYD